MIDVSDIDPRTVFVDVPPEVWEQIPEMMRWGIKVWRGSVHRAPLKY